MKLCNFTTVFTFSPKPRSSIIIIIYKYYFYYSVHLRTFL